MKVCGKKDIHVPECDDCSELEERVEAVEECCDDAHDEIDTLNTDKADKDYVDDSIETVNQTIVDVADTLGERIDNIITSSEPSVTTLWEGVMESIGDSANLSEDVNDFDYLDIYYRTSADESEGYYNTVRIPADQFANYTITVGGTLSPLGESPNLSQYLTQLSFVDDTATIDNIREWSWNGSQSSDASDDPQAETGVTIYRIDGVKETGGNAEIADARIGVDGTVYPSLGDAIRGQIQDTRDMIPQLVKTVQGNPIVIDDAWGEVKNLDVELLPIQDLHGYDNPWSAGAGKNKLDFSQFTAGRTAFGLTSALSGEYFRFTGTCSSGGAHAWAFCTVPSAQDAIASACSYKAFVISGTAPTISSVSYSTGTLVISASGMVTNQTYDFTIGVVGYTDGTAPTAWTPYSNICPITGHDSVSVTDTGLNLWGGTQMATDIVNTINNQTYAYTGSDSDGDYVALKVGNAINQKLIPTTKYKPNTRYTAIVTYKKNSSNAASNLMFTYTDGTHSYINPSGGDLSVKTTYAGVSDANKTIEGIYSVWANGTAQFYYDECGVFEGVKTASDFLPYYGQSKTVTLPHTVYGAGVGVTSGTSKDEWNFVTLTGVETYQAYGTTIVCRSVTVPAGANYTDVVCNYADNTIVGWSNASKTQFQFKNADTFWGVSGADEFKALIASFNTAGTPLAICYRLADALDLQTTPTPLTLYSGDNVISSDGDMELSYVQDMAIVIRKIENQL